MIRLISAATFCLLLFGALSVQPVDAQQSRNNIPTTGPWDSAEQMRKGQEQAANSSIAHGALGPRSGRDLASSRYGSPTIRLTGDVLEKQEKLLQPAKADRAANAQFLKQPHAGLLRLLPESTSKVVSVEKLSREPKHAYTLPGGGAYYSFTKLNHVPNLWADLRFTDGKLEVAFGMEVVGALTMLGDVPLDSLTTESEGVSLLAKYEPPSEVKRAKREHERFKGGVALDHLLFKTAFQVQKNMTYALRSIAYNRSDLLVAFRVLRQEEDGSVLLLWKRIEKFPTPKLKVESK